MLLEERRSVLRYVLLNLITLGLYGLYYAAELARDTEVACHGDGKHSYFGKKDVFFSIVTFGIYYTVWMCRLIKRWNDHSTKTHMGVYVNIASYCILRHLWITAPFAIRDCFGMLGRLCEEFNTEFFRIDENDPFARKAKLIIEEVTEKRVAANETVAGYRIIEEYDASKDKRRIDHTAEEAARAALLAELEAERLKEEQEKCAAAEAEAARIKAENERKREEKALLAHRNPKWFRRAFPVMLAIFMLPIIAVCIISFALPPVYDNTFVGELAEKYDRLNAIDEPKLVVIGGSSVAFGLDSELAEEKLGMKVVNFGLYANLGTKLMLDLSKTNINEGDIIVIAPELNDQTLSLYFNAETTVQALDGNWRMLKNIDSDNYEACIGALWGFSSEKLRYMLSGTRPENSGAYKKDQFNEYGDNTFERPYNTMKSTSKNILLNYRVNPEDSYTSEYEAFIDYVNSYTAYCEKRGATVYFSFAPMNAAAMADENTEESIYNFYKNLCGYLDCKVISSVNDYIMDEGYFFDSEFHLNDSGVTVRTVQLIDDIKRERGDTSLTISANDLPKPSGYAPLDTVGGDEENLYFELELVDSNGSLVWSVVGLNDDGMVQSVLKIPANVINEADGVSYPVVTVAANAFAGSLVETVYLGENISVIASKAFSGATALKSVYLPLSKQADDVSIPNDFDAGGLATDGANDALKIYVNEKYLTDFKSGYFWGDYSKRLVGYSE